MNYYNANNPFEWETKDTEGEEICLGVALTISQYTVGRVVEIKNRICRMTPYLFNDKNAYRSTYGHIVGFGFPNAAGEITILVKEEGDEEPHAYHPENIKVL